MNALTLTSTGSSAEMADDLLDEVEKVMRSLVTRGEPSGGDMLSNSARAAFGHLAAGGQRVRARLALGAGVALDLAPHDSIALAATAELLHNASLVHDDLQDREKIRRGNPTVWAAYGDEVAICAGDLLLSASYGALASVSDSRLLPELIALVHARTALVVRGQCTEFSAKGQKVADMAVYERIAVGKSGALLSLPLELALSASGKKEWVGEARRAAEAFGIGYQIMDDMEDVESDAGGYDGPRAVNALLVLRAAGHGLNAEAMAREIGLRHLRTAVASADLLPNGAGALLRCLALSLCQRL
jgi:geranylgeranyl pyrophosphate synthase